MRSEKAKITAQASAKLKPAATREGDQDGDGTTDYIHSLSHRSDASATSFAFPMYDLSAFYSLTRFTIQVFNV
jgi:hypothetical protein